MIRVTSSIWLNEDEITETFVRASGPGGQNVNKVSTAVELRFDARHSPSLPEEVRARLEKLAGSRLTQDGVLIITAQEHRTQPMNRERALAKLVELIQQAAQRPRPRRATKPTKGSQERRLASKTKRGGVKALRGRKAGDE